MFQHGGVDTLTPLLYPLVNLRKVFRGPPDIREIALQEKATHPYD